MMKKIIFFISSLFFLQNSANAIILNTTLVSWSASTGLSFFVYGISLGLPNVTCSYLFQNTTKTSYTAEGSFSAPVDSNGVFSFTVTNSTQCSALAAGFVMLLECFAYEPFTNNETARTSAQTISTCVL